jgi:PhnB protein
LHHVGHGDDIVAQLAVGDAAFWVTTASPDMKRFSPESIGGSTGRNLLIVDDPIAVLEQAVRAGAREVAAVTDEHGWQLGRIVDLFGHEWKIGRPLGEWPPRWGVGTRIAPTQRPMPAELGTADRAVVGLALCGEDKPLHERGLRPRAADHRDQQQTEER